MLREERAQADTLEGLEGLSKPDQLRLLLDALEHQGPLTVAWKSRDRFSWRSNLTLGQACVEANRRHEGDTWYSVNPTRAAGSGRGKAEDVVGLTSLYADLDAKADGLGSYAACWDVVHDVSGRLGVAPTAVVDSGHGLQPYWRIANVRWDRQDMDERRLASATLKAFGNLVVEAAGTHGGSVDSVFDLARIFRVPGTTNVKDPERPRPARLLLLDPDAPALLYEPLRQLLNVGSSSSRGLGGSDRRPGQASASVRAVEAVISEVEQAANLSRNMTLNRVVFELVRDLRWSPEVAQRVRSAALQTGLPEDEVDRTIDSALTRGQESTHDADQWLSAVLAFLERTRPRNRIALALAARHLRDLACRVDGPLGMSCRRLADLMQIPKSTSALYLRTLRRDGWLALEEVRTDRLKPRRYRLSTPEAWRLDSYPVEDLPYGELSNFTRSHSGLFAHDAFSRRKGTTSLPKRCAVVLEVLCQHPEQVRSVKELARLTTYSPSTIRQALLELESAGHLHYKRRTGAVLLEGHEAWTDIWASWSGAAGNTDARRQQHQTERQRHAQYKGPVSGTPVSRAAWLPTRGKE